MLYTASELVPERQKVISAQLGMNLREALAIMDNEKFSQLPVIDQEGFYLGMLSEHSIVAHLHGSVRTSAVLNETIDRWYEDDKAISLDTDVYDVLELLKKRDAVTIVDDSKCPYGVITHYDTAQFYGTYAYGFMLIEYIERTLRRYIESTCPTQQERDDVLAEAKKHATSHLPDRYEDLTLRGYLDTFYTKRYWAKFESHFGARETFLSTLDEIPKIRNDAMHFRHEKLSERQLETLRTAASFLTRCEKRYPPISTAPISEA